MKNSQDQGVVSSLIIGVLMLAVTGCSTVVPVTAKFPDAPGRLATQSCPDLQKLKDDARLSDVSRTITLNYSTYYECAVKTDAWIEWYGIQKIISEGVK
jgi:hypothetical protein